MLSNASTLLFLLQRTLKASGETTDASDTLQQVDAKYPALHFKQQLTTYVEKLCGIIRDNLKKRAFSGTWIVHSGIHYLYKFFLFSRVNPIKAFNILLYKKM